MGRVRFAVILVLTLAALLAGCSGDDEVTMTEVSHPDTKDMVVWSPGGDGPWPVVYALPGRSGLAQVDLDVLGPALAEQGVLVIATDYRTGDTVAYTDRDVECGIIALGSCHNNWLSDPLPAVEITRPFNDTDGTVLIVSGENDDVCPADQHLDRCLPCSTSVGSRRPASRSPRSHQNLVLHEQANGGAALTAEDPVAQDTVTAILQAIEDAQQP